MLDSLETDTTFVGEAGDSYTSRLTSYDRVGNMHQVEKVLEVFDTVKYYICNRQKIASLA